jgi:folate-binding protein YgfZ
MTPSLSLKDSYDLLKTGAVALETDRDAVFVRGPDARAWLQGQVSQDLDKLALGESAETLVLSPQGKVDSYCRATVVAKDVIVLDTDAGHGAALCERLRRFRLRVKAELESAPLLCWSVRGPLARAVLDTAGLATGLIAPPEAAAAGFLAVIGADWPGYAGFDVLGPADRVKEVLLAVRFGDPAAFEAARIEAGVPRIGRELTERTIPQEAGAVVEHAVSFTKGCYTGQELVARLDARGGNVAWRLRGVVLESGAQSRPGAPLLAGDREVGHLTSLTWSPGYAAPVALAYVRRDVVPPLLATTAPDMAQAEIRELPLQIG